MNNQTQTTQLKLRPTHDDIFINLYKFRFLNRIQFQKIFKHKYHSRTLHWLNELANAGYIRQYYDKKFASSPTVYSLGPLGRKYLKNNPKFKEISTVILNRIWGEEELSIEFRDHWQLLADIYLSLELLTNKTEAKLHFSTANQLYGTQYLILPNPDSYLAIEESNGTIKRYFLDILEDEAPRKLRKRVRQYFNYYTKSYWQNHTDKPFPEIILICPNSRMKSHMNYFIQGKLKRQPELKFYLSTWEQVKSQGLIKETLQKVSI